jgi:hypothetical protein
VLLYYILNCKFESKIQKSYTEDEVMYLRKISYCIMIFSKKIRSYSMLTTLSILTKGTKIQVLTECFREVRFIVLVSET